MALPWLIGAAAIALVTAVVKAANDSDSSNKDDDDADAREAHRRATAERERVEGERRKKTQAATTNFVSRGDTMGHDIAESLNGWIDVVFERSPAFTAKFVSSDGGTVQSILGNGILGAFAKVQNSISYESDHSGLDEKVIHSIIPDGDYNFNTARENLKFYSSIYAVKLGKGAELVKISEDIKEINAELKEILKIKKEISRLRSHISSQS